MIGAKEQGPKRARDALRILSDVLLGSDVGIDTSYCMALYYNKSKIIPAEPLNYRASNQAKASSVCSDVRS